MAQSPDRGKWLCLCFPLLFPYPFNPIDGGNRFWGVLLSSSVLLQCLQLCPWDQDTALTPVSICSRLSPMEGTLRLGAGGTDPLGQPGLILAP